MAKKSTYIKERKKAVAGFLGPLLTTILTPLAMTYLHLAILEATALSGILSAFVTGYVVERVKNYQPLSNDDQARLEQWVKEQEANET